MKKAIKKVLVPLGVKNLNDRIYDLKAAEKIIADFNIRKQIGIYGELGHPEEFDMHGSISLSNTSHLIENIEIEDNCIVGYIKVLNTKKGKILKEDINNYVFRPRSSGTIDNNGVITIEKFITFDAILKETDAFGNI